MNPNTNVVETKIEPVSTTKSPLLSKKAQMTVILLIAVILSLLVGIGGTAYYYSQKDKNKEANNTQVTPTPTVESTMTPTPTMNPNLVDSGLKAVAFTKYTSNTDLGLWVVDTLGKSVEIGDYKDIQEVKNYSGTDWISFTQKLKANTIVYYNYHTGEFINVTIQNGSGYKSGLTPISISPDGNYFLYDANFYKDVVVNDGPAPEFDPYPNPKVGTYIYNNSTDKSAYLGNFGTALYLNWSDDLKSYYLSVNFEVTYNGTKIQKGVYKIDPSTATYTLIDKDIAYISFANYYYDMDGLKVTYRSNTESSGKNESIFTIYKNNISKYTKTGKFADIQPFFYISPDGKNGITLDTATKSTDSRALYKWEIVDLTTFKAKPFLTDTSATFSSKPFWLDNENVAFAIRKYPGIETNGDIYIYNLKTGMTKQLTTDGISVLYNN